MCLCKPETKGRSLPSLKQAPSVPVLFIYLCDVCVYMFVCVGVEVNGGFLPQHSPPFFIFYLLETRFLCVALAVLELAL